MHTCITESRSLVLRLLSTITVLLVPCLWGALATAQDAESDATMADDEVVVATDGGTVVVQGEREVGLVATTSVITKDLPVAADVGAAVERVPGVTVDRLGGLGAYSSVRLRGAGSRQVEVMLDGVPLNPDGVGTVDLSELPLRAFERVDVMRGGASAGLASSASSGVVNLVSGQQPPPTVLRASVGSAGGVRLGTQGGGQGMVRGVALDRLAVLDLFHTRGDQLVLDDKNTRFVPEDDVLVRRPNADIWQASGHARLRFGRPEQRLSLIDAFTLRKSGVPGPVEATTREVRYGLLRNLLVAQGDRTLEQVQLQARLWSMQRLERLQDPLGEIGFVVRDDRTLTNTTGARAQARYVPSEYAAAQATVELRREVLWQQGDAGAQRGVVRVTTGADLHVLNDRLQLSPQLIGLWIHDRGHEGFTSPLRQMLTPRLALGAGLTDALSVRANAGALARPPDFLELFGDQGSVVGNPGLKPESGWQGDVGLLLALERGPLQLSAELGGFGSYTVDRITWVQNAQRRMMPINLDAVSVLGGELGAQLSLWQRLQSTTAITTTHARQISDRVAYHGKRLPSTPSWTLRQATRLTLGQLSLAHRYDRTSGTFLDATNWYAAPPRSLHTGTVALRLGDTGAGLELDVRNALNRRSDVVPANPLDPSGSTLVEVPMVDQAGFPLPGRSVMLSLRWEAP